MRWVLAIALGVLALHLAVNGHYGFHRDELATLDDARHLAWGYVAYPPLTPFAGRMELALFGASISGVRLLPAINEFLVILLTALMTRELGGGRWAQAIAALAIASSPVSLASGSLLQYVSFDYLWWVLIAFLLIHLLRTDDDRWWLAIGAVFGLGLMTKYTIAVLAVAIAAGLLMPGNIEKGGWRRHLRSRWFWLGTALAFVMFLPNMIWQAQHGFISLDFVRSIHARDIRIGRTKNFLLDQFFICTNPLAVPVWIAGLFVLWKRLRPLFWMFAVSLIFFAAVRGRGYYLAGAYPPLFAAGALYAQRWKKTAALVLTAALPLSIVFAMPIVPVNSALWATADKANGDFREEIGWPELVAEVTRVAGTHHADAILTANYGEAGALDLLGHGLPRVISPINSYGMAGYGDPPPQTLIVVGFDPGDVDHIFNHCQLAGHVSNRDGVRNAEAESPDIFVCTGLKSSWPEFWKRLHHFG